MNESQVLKKNRRGTEYIEANGEIIAKRCSGCGEMMELEHFPNLKRYNEKRPEYTKGYYEKHGNVYVNVLGNLTLGKTEGKHRCPRTSFFMA